MDSVVRVHKLTYDVFVHSPYMFWWITLKKKMAEINSVHRVIKEAWDNRTGEFMFFLHLLKWGKEKKGLHSGWKENTVLWITQKFFTRIWRHNWSQSHKYPKIMVLQLVRGLHTLISFLKPVTWPYTNIRRAEWKQQWHKELTSTTESKASHAL